MNTPSETIVVPAADGKKEPESKLSFPNGKKVSRKKTPKAVARKPAPKNARKAVMKAAPKKATKPTARNLKRREFPYQRVLKMWKAGKTLEAIARATGRFQKDADDPLRSFRVKSDPVSQGREAQGSSGEAALQGVEVIGESVSQGGKAGVRVMDTVGKVFVAQDSLRKCVICDVLFSREASREHSVKICFPAPPECPPIPLGVMEAEV
jgi:hypothetical protein